MVEKNGSRFFFANLHGTGATAWEGGKFIFASFSRNWMKDFFFSICLIALSSKVRLILNNSVIRKLEELCTEIKYTLLTFSSHTNFIERVI